MRPDGGARAAGDPTAHGTSRGSNAGGPPINDKGFSRLCFVPPATRHEYVLDTPSPQAITLAWLVRLRWGAVAGQALALCIATVVLQLELPLFALGTIVATTALSNSVLSYWLHRASQLGRFANVAPGALLAIDTLCLAALLGLSGGPSNPFSVFFLVYVTLAAVVLGMRWAWAIVAISALSYGALFIWHIPVTGLHHHHTHDAGPSFSAHLQGMWVAFTSAALLISFFVSRLSMALRDRDAALARSASLTARAERLASLTTLAAGAAHELGTPLSTIAIAAEELTRTLERLALAGPESEAAADARLIQAEVERCRDIVHRMSAQAGVTLGEIAEPLTAGPVFAKCIERLRQSSPSTARADIVLAVDVDATEVSNAVFICPPEGLVQILLNLLQNALYASASGESPKPVFLSASSNNSSVELVVEDQGSGIDPAHLARIGEPFFTTKPAGAGMGLGLFLVQSFAERWGGTFRIESHLGKGTRATVTLPRIHGTAKEAIA